MDTAIPLEEGDQRTDRTGRERVAAHQQRVETEHRPQLLVLDVLGDQRVHAAQTAQPKQVRRHLRHVRPAGERHVPKLFETHPIDRLAVPHERVGAIDVTRA